MGRKITMQDKRELVTKIIQGEWEMFRAVNDQADTDPLTRNRPSCRDYPEEFRLHRTSKLLAWSKATLESYLEDITRARENGINLMTYKYARMDNLIPCENTSPFIDLITAALMGWQKQFIDAYPAIMTGARGLKGPKPGTDWASFENYLRCELETYSEKTLGLLLADIDTMRAEGKSMSEEIYTYLVQEKGYKSLDDAERKQAGR